MRYFSLDKIEVSKATWIRASVSGEFPRIAKGMKEIDQGSF
jgi:hypothetical protein